MVAELFGIQHFIYIGISTIIGGGGLFLAYKFAKTEKTQNIEFFRFLDTIYSKIADFLCK